MLSPYAHESVRGANGRVVTSAAPASDGLLPYLYHAIYLSHHTMDPYRLRDTQVQYEAVTINARPSIEDYDHYFDNPLASLLCSHAKILRYRRTCTSPASLLQFVVPRTLPPSVREVSSQAPVSNKQPIGIFKIFKIFCSLESRRIEADENVMIRLRRCSSLEYLYSRIDVVLLCFNVLIDTKEKIEESVLYEVSLSFFGFPLFSLSRLCLWDNFGNITKILIVASSNQTSFSKCENSFSRPKETKQINFNTNDYNGWSVSERGWGPNGETNWSCGLP